MSNEPVQAVTVLVPSNPFVQDSLKDVAQCLAVLNVAKLMEWWPGKPHTPHRDPGKVKAIQRSLDWKRVAHIASYLLQKEIVDVPDRLDEYFRDIYDVGPKEPGVEWPPKVTQVVGYLPSAFPTFSNVLLHVNGARLEPSTHDDGAGTLIFNEDDISLNFSVIDGQHRINGAYFAVCIRRETEPDIRWDIPAEIFLDLDKRGEPPRKQAQIFIDVNSYQKKVDKSLVADLFPTARGPRRALDNKERAQDLGRKLMLEIGPLVGMIQIPGIKFGVKDVVTLATLNSAIENVIEQLEQAGITSLEAQAEFLAQCLDAWLVASGRKEEVTGSGSIDPENVAYQGRVVVSFLTLTPWCIWALKKTKRRLISDAARDYLTTRLRTVMQNAGLLKGGVFIAKQEFKDREYLGSGGLARFRDTLWAAALRDKPLNNMKDATRENLAAANRSKVLASLSKSK